MEKAAATGFSSNLKALVQGPAESHVLRTGPEIERAVFVDGRL